MSFKRDFKQAQERITADMEKRIRAGALQLFASVIERTPVGNPDLWQTPAPPGYIGGTARGNWQTTLGAPATGAIGHRSEQQAMSEASLTTARYTLADTLYLANNLPYIQRLEDGYSGQAPAGMVAVSVNSFTEAMRK